MESSREVDDRVRDLLGRFREQRVGVVLEQALLLKAIVACDVAPAREYYQVMAVVAEPADEEIDGVLGLGIEAR
jgi:hypothetical protein